LVRPAGDGQAVRRRSDGAQKGETTAKPVQTQFGFHVIRLDDVREVQPPPFEQVKPQMTQVVLAKTRAYGDELAKAAKVEKKLQ
jgi:peptidyl-prolyl cis-trans isomerase C